MRHQPVNYLQSMMRYKKWTNDLLYPVVATVPQKEQVAPRPIVFGSLLRTLNHTYAMDLVWQAHLEGRPHGFTTRWPEDCPPLEELAVAQQQVDRWFIDYAEQLSPSAENESVSFTFIGGNPSSMTRRDMLLHVVNHGTYHRGHVTGILYDCNVTPPTTDYPVFLKQDVSD